MRWWTALLIALLGCGAEEDDSRDAGLIRPADAGTTTDAGSMDAGQIDAGPPPDQITLGGDRPAALIVPEDYDGTPRPLVILLHGYSVDAASQDAYFRISPHVDARGFFLLLPNGTREASSSMFRFWNATDACCNFYGSTVDDVAYLRGLIDEARARFAIRSVHLIGHSNGGFMAYRMACDAADVIDSIATLAGATFFDESNCNPSEATRVLHIHGTNDTTILYDGVASGPMRYPGAEETVERWAARAGCNLAMMESGPPIDLERLLPGVETDVHIYEIGCTAPIEVELWRINGGTHVPTLADDFADRVLDWSFAP